MTAGPERGGAAAPAVLFGVALLLLIVGAPTAFVWFDQLRHWGQALEQIRNGVWIPPRGASVTGVGANGPMYHLILMSGLRLLSSETAMAFFSACSAALGLATAARLAARRWGAAAVLWPLAAVASHPILLEWMRVGLDHSFLPLWLPLGLACWLWVERRPSSVGRWILWGVACGAGLQLHFTIGPALALASLPLWKPRQVPWAPLATIAGALLTYAPMLGGPAVQSPGLTWFDAPSTAGRLIQAAVAAPAARAAGVGLGSVWWLLPGTVIGLAAVGGAAVGAARPAVRRGLAVAAASLLLVSFDEASHYHHLMHLDAFLIAMTTTGALALAADRRGRAVLAVLVAAHLALGARMVADAQGRGIVELPSSYPLAWPDAREIAATAWQRDALAKALAELDLDHPVLRQVAVSGDVLPFFEHGWMFLADQREPASSGQRIAEAWRLTAGACVDGGRRVGGFCLREAAVPPLSAVVTEESGFLVRTALRGELSRQGLSFPPEMAQLELVRAGRFPLRVSAPEGRRFSRLTLRFFRFPVALERVGAVPILPDGLGEPALTRDGYVVREEVWHVADPVTEVVLRASGLFPLVAYYAELELDGR